MVLFSFANIPATSFGCPARNAGGQTYFPRFRRSEITSKSESKSTGAIMEKAVVVALVTGAFGFVGGVSALAGKYFHELYLGRRKDQLERVNEQLKLLYGPLFALNKATEITWVAFVKRYCNDPNFRTANNRIRPQTPETQEIWRHWMKNVFMPLNVQMA